MDVASDVDDDDDFEESVDSEDSGDIEEAIDSEDFNDTMKIEGVLTGEEWLTSNFLLSNNEATAQSATITRKIEDLKEDKLNKSDVSKSRPISPFGTENNPFQLSKVGYYANPVSLDRSLQSALKTRNKIPRTPDNINDQPDWKEAFEPEEPFNLESYIGKKSNAEELKSDTEAQIKQVKIVKEIKN